MAKRSPKQPTPPNVEQYIKDYEQYIKDLEAYIENKQQELGNAERFIMQYKIDNGVTT